MEKGRGGGGRDRNTVFHGLCGEAATAPSSPPSPSTSLLSLVTIELTTRHHFVTCDSKETVDISVHRRLSSLTPFMCHVLGPGRKKNRVESAVGARSGPHEAASR